MKFTLHIDPAREEECIVYAKEQRPLLQSIERLVRESESYLLGRDGEDLIVLDPAEVCCFITEEEKVCAVIGHRRLTVKKRLYQLLEELGGDFIRINQGCIANVRKIERFTPSIGGALQVVFLGGHRDYVSRRELKHVKERIGI